MTDNEPPTPPHGMDADEYRRFQEFQRFQDYQRFVEAQRQGANLPVPVQPGQPVPHHPQPPALETQLDGMRQQLARIERVTNPPLWKKILGNKWLHRAVWLVIIVALAVWGIPTLIEHYFGGNQPSGQDALHPGQVPGSGKLYNDPADAVAEFYHVIMGGPPGNATACQVPTAAGGQQFARDLGVANCTAAINKIYSELTPDGRAAYENVQVGSALVQLGGTAQVSSCAMQIDAGPRLGLFLLTRNQTGDWQITGHQNEPNPCPPPPSTTAAVPTS